MIPNATAPVFIVYASQYKFPDTTCTVERSGSVFHPYAHDFALANPSSAPGAPELSAYIAAFKVALPFE
jgi:hypothetical protein